MLDFIYRTLYDTNLFEIALSRENVKFLPLFNITLLNLLLFNGYRLVINNVMTTCYITLSAKTNNVMTTSVSTTQILIEKKKQL